MVVVAAGKAGSCCRPPGIDCNNLALAALHSAKIRKRPSSGCSATETIEAVGCNNPSRIDFLHRILRRQA